MKTIAQMLGVTEFPFEIRDKEGNKMKTNIITPITPEMRQSLPEGYAIYGNGSEEFADLVKKAGRPKLMRWDETSASWSSPLGYAGDRSYFIYAVPIPIGSEIYSLLCEDEPQSEPDTEQTEESRLLLDSIKAIVERDGASTIELRLGNDTLIPHEWGLHGDKLWIELRREG